MKEETSMNKKYNINQFNSQLQKDKEKLRQAAKKAENAEELISDIDKQFESTTGLDKKDMAFLITATALQLVRQYALGTLLNKRTDHNEADKKIKKDEKNKIKRKDLEEPKCRKHRYYNPSLAEVMCYPVSIDVKTGSKGILKGGGKLEHRSKTAGHDPLLGLVLGTANIATSTVTTLPDFKSYHVVSGYINGRNHKNIFGNNAKTRLVLKYTMNKVFSKNLEQMTIVATALIREVNHLRSDIHSKNSLPLPFVSAFSPELASELAEIGLDAANMETFSVQAGVAKFINILIAMLHRLCYDEKEIDKELFKVKTRKIINYSNIIASSSNVIAAAIAATIGVVSENPKVIKKSIDYLDIGGITVTICTLLSDSKQMYDIKREFMKNEWYKIIKGD